MLSVPASSDSVVDVPADALAAFHPTLRRWFVDTFDAPTRARYRLCGTDELHCLNYRCDDYGKCMPTRSVALCLLSVQRQHRTLAVTRD